MKPRTALRILLVLSMISAGYSIFANFSMAFFLPLMDRFYQANSEMFPEEFFTLWERMATVPQSYYAGLAVLAILSLAGCILMWNLRRSGFHCYTIAQLLMLALPLLFLGKGFFGLGDLMFTILFIYLYYILLKKLDVFSPGQEISDPQEGVE